MNEDLTIRWLFEDTPLLASIVDHNGRFAQVSKELARRLGRTPDTFVGMPPDDICSAASVQRLRESYRPTLRRTGKLYAMPIEFVAADGTPLHLVVSTLTVSPSGDEKQYSISVYEDLRDSEQAVRRFQNFYHLSPTMLHTMDGAGRLLDVSEQWLSKLGYEREDVLGHNIRRYLSDSTRAQLREGQLSLLRDKLEYNNHPREMVTRDGRILEVLMSARAERDEFGEVKRMYVASKDVTERNASVRALRDALHDNTALRKSLENERDYLREEVNVSMNFGRIVGSSDVLQLLLSRIEAVAQTNASVLIVGESGTGKELVAHAAHAAGNRAGEPLVKVNCASIPAELFESEFFGHVKGAFTGAHRDRVGRFALADGGTIFLDEVGEIPLNLQGKLLRVLQEKEFERVGDDRTQVVDVRVIAATNRDLLGEVKAGRFREDLYYRLSVFPVDVPPLRERGDDVLQIAAHLLRQIGAELGRPALELTRSQALRIRGYHWPGNVRELRNRLERAVIMSQDGTLRIELPETREPESVTASHAAPPPFFTADQMRDQERQNLKSALEFANWRVSGVDGAADLLGMKPTTLSGRIKSLGIERPVVARGRPPRKAL
ncbi:MAG: sigma 54-interacting transcriptional regulator [Gammaproteobacteria bacterium]